VQWWAFRSARFLALAILLGVFIASIDFVPPLHHAVTYNHLTRRLGTDAISRPGMVFIGPFSTLRLVPSTLQTTAFGEDGTDGGAVWARANTGLQVVLVVTVQWRYRPENLPLLLGSTESLTPAVTRTLKGAEQRTFLPAYKFIRPLTISSLCAGAARYSPHEFFYDKDHLTRDLAAHLRATLDPFVTLEALQILRTDVPQSFDEAMMSSALARLSITRVEHVKLVKQVEFRTLALAARYTYLATVATAHGTAAQRWQQGVSNAATLKQTVAAEMQAFANVSQRVGQVSPRDVLDYAWWQLAIGEDPVGKRQRPPLHDILLPRPKART
jgi:hypothetical protein